MFISFNWVIYWFCYFQLFYFKQYCLTLSSVFKTMLIFQFWKGLSIIYWAYIFLKYLYLLRIELLLWRIVKHSPVWETCLCFTFSFIFLCSDFYQWTLWLLSLVICSNWIFNYFHSHIQSITYVNLFVSHFNFQMY